MSESKLRDLSMDFSVQIINLVKDLKSKHEMVISNQIGRSGTSIGANIYEANYAQGKRILSQNLRSRSRKQVKQGIGLNFCIGQGTWMIRRSNLWETNVLPSV